MSYFKPVKNLAPAWIKIFFSRKGLTISNNCVATKSSPSAVTVTLLRNSETGSWIWPWYEIPAFLISYIPRDTISEEISSIFWLDAIEFIAEIKEKRFSILFLFVLFLVSICGSSCVSTASGWVSSTYSVLFICSSF